MNETPEGHPVAAVPARSPSPPRPPSVLVFERIDPTDASLDWLEAQGIAVVRGRAMWQQPYWRYGEDEIIAAAQGHVAVMGASGARFPRRVIEALPDLRFIAKFGIGVETIDLEAATGRGILVANTPEQLDIDAVAEHTIAMILAIKKRLLDWTPRYMQEGGWRPGFFAEMLAGDTLGLVGFGRIGRAVADRLQGWNVRLVAYDPYITDMPPHVTPIDLDSLLASSDIVSLHAGSTPANRKMIGARAIALMKPSALLVNCARAWLVDMAALTDALERGRIAGAAIDVYDSEPPDPADRLFRLKNVVVTPHAAAWTFKGLEKIGWHACRNLRAMIFGEGQADIVNRPRGQPA